MIRFNQLSIRRGTKLLLQPVDWTIYAGQRIGLTGANGSGKSSLFALLLGQLAADGGEIEIGGQPVFSHVAQEMPAGNESALDFVVAGDTELHAIQQQLQTAEAADDGMEIAHLHEALNKIDAWSAPSRAGRMLAGLGFSTAEQQQAVRDFSGGWRMRLNLARALMCRSDVLLLDEPTNHLDLDAVIWLESWLKTYPGTLLLISHDRDFLDSAIEYIAHIENQTLTVYTGNYSAFEDVRAERLMQQQAAYTQQQKKVAHLQSFVDRFRAKASKARQAQSRIKALAKLERVQAVQQSSPFQFSFRKPDSCPNPLVTLAHIRAGYGKKTVFPDVSLSVGPGDRIALLGPNGAGKSTLVKSLAGEIPLLDGERATGAGLRIGYFAQHHVDHLQADETPMAQLQRIAPNIMEREARGFLGTFGFSGSRVFEPVKIFSGGEKSRLALALIIWQKPNLLLLDEPTNHLDMEMRNALSLALQEYEGALILVSHDRFLVRTTVDQLMLVAHGELQAFHGDLTEYEKWLIAFRRETENAARTDKPGKVFAASPRQQAQTIKKLENRIKKLQTSLENIETQLADTRMYEFNHKETLDKLLAERDTIQTELTTTEETWLAACEKI